MKFLLVIVVIAVLLWLMFGRRRVPPPAGPAPPPAPPTPAAMIACAHCGVHLPRGDALAGAGERWFCSEAHRIAGPR